VSQESPAREGILLFFPEVLPAAPDDLGVLFRSAGRYYFVDAERVAEVAPVLPVSQLPGSRGRGVAFWRGRAHEVIGEGGSAAKGFVLLRRFPADCFVVSETLPATISRRSLSPEVTDFPEES
jgi:hypothetical protein